ncbi:MAG: D-glycero-beta-D-manno-heptose 1-phosphate adenylyltransferase [Pseudomonadota bacterium]
MTAPFTLAALTDTRILCIGDLLLDVTITGTIARISPEAPVPILRETHQNLELGGAGLVARNLVSLGVRTTCFCVTGQDADGDKIASLFSDMPKLQAHIIRSERPTTRKTRYVSAGQQVFRSDFEITSPIDDDCAQAIIDGVRNHMSHCDAVILSDYGKGCLRDDLCADLIALAKEHHCPVFCDPKGANYQKYHGANFITPNYAELQDAAVFIGADADADLSGSLGALQKELALEGILATRSAEGCSLWHKGLRTDIPTQAREVFDVIGAGDAVIATFAACLGAGADHIQAAELANLAGGIVVGKRGAATIMHTELHAATTQLHGNSTDSQIAHDHLMQSIAIWRESGLKIGFTNGCFDLLHAGHISLLAVARAACDRLIVAINSDDSVRKLKGEERPITSQQDRAMILQQLQSVDAVTIFDRDTPLALIEQIIPDVLVKGGDYSFDTVVGAPFVKAYGGAVVIVQTMPNRATSHIIKKIKSTKPSENVSRETLL